MNMAQMLEFRLVVQHLIQRAECDGIGLERWPHAPDADSIKDAQAIVGQILDEEG